jgi:predicted Fe-Mo cluster-binding NifX family protein
MTKIAFATDDGETVGQHFGKTKLYAVADLEQAGEQGLEQRAKWHHGMQENHAQPHSHDSMFEPIQDCQVLVVGGMGQPAYQSARAQGLEVILTGEKSIAAAVEAFRSGNLVSDERRVHQHR